MELTAPKARSRSSEVVTLDEVPRISPRESSKLPSLASSSLVIGHHNRLSGKNLGMIGHFSWLGAKKYRAERDIYNAASAAKF